MLRFSVVRGNIPAVIRVDIPGVREPIEVWRQDGSSYGQMCVTGPGLLGGTALCANVLHGLELGIAAAARWIAVELAKNPEPSAEEIQGVTLWLDNRAGGVVLANGIVHGALCGHSSQGNVSRGSIRVEGAEVVEQALAPLIERAAPWIAVALMKEIEEES